MCHAPSLVLRFAAVLSLVAVARAQTFEVPGDFATIQSALDAAPAGAVIVVRGGTWGSITIERPVTLIGAPAPLFEGGDGGVTDLPNRWDAPITLAGPGHGSVVLVGIKTFKEFVDGMSKYGYVAPGIEGGGFDELHVYDSDVRAPNFCFYGTPFCNLSGTGAGTPGIGVSVPFVVVERSSVEGSRTDSDIGAPAAADAAGIDAPGTVVVVDSSVTGGSAGAFDTFFIGGCPPSSCPDLPGGPGVRGDTLHHAGSTIAGGQGATWIDYGGGGFCCQSDPGSAFEVTLERPMLNDLSAAGPMVLGRDYVLRLSAPGPLARLLVAVGLEPPLHLVGLGDLFLPQETTQSLGPVVTPGEVRLRIPADPAFLGRTISFQLVDPTNGLSRPVVAVPVPRKLVPEEEPQDAGTRAL